MKRWFRRLRANLHYLRRPLREFLPSLSLLVILSALCGWSFYVLYEPEPGEPRLTLQESLYVAYALIFSQDLPPFREWPTALPCSR